jgi:PTH1 family peptidyl-tRNA hydrolase
MALFTKKTAETSSNIPMYTVGSQTTLLIVGLGNPGKEYNGTRHNVGFDCIDAFVEAHEEFSSWIGHKDQQYVQTSAIFGGTRVIVIKPTTFMNLSGEAVRAVQHFYKIPIINTVVVYDELDIDFGQIRIRSGGESAGHNGIKSIIAQTDDSFGRIRIGINSPTRTKNDEKDFVLKKFSADEQKQLPSLKREIDSLLIEYIYRGNLLPETRSFLI